MLWNQKSFWLFDSKHQPIQACKILDIEQHVWEKFNERLKIFHMHTPVQGGLHESGFARRVGYKFRAFGKHDI